MFKLTAITFVPAESIFEISHFTSVIMNVLTNLQSAAVLSNRNNQYTA